MELRLNFCNLFVTRHMIQLTLTNIFFRYCYNIKILYVFAIERSTLKYEIIRIYAIMIYIFLRQLLQIRYYAMWLTNWRIDISLEQFINWTLFYCSILGYCCLFCNWWSIGMDSNRANGRWVLTTKKQISKWKYVITECTCIVNWAIPEIRCMLSKEDMEILMMSEEELFCFWYIKSRNSQFFKQFLEFQAWELPILLSKNILAISRGVPLILNSPIRV